MTHPLEWIEFKQDEVQEIDDAIASVNSLYEMNSPQDKAHLRDERDRIVDLLKGAKKYISANIGLKNPRNEYLPSRGAQEFPLTAFTVAGLRLSRHLLNTVYGEIAPAKRMSKEARQARSKANFALFALAENIEWVVGEMRRADLLGR